MNALQRITLVMLMSAFWNGFLVFTIWLACVTLPLRFVGMFPKHREQDSKVKIFVHEPKTGSSDATPRDTLLLVHGFPDNQRLWDKAVEALTENGYRCLVAALPGSNGESVPKAPSFREMARLIKEAVDGETDQAVTVIAHDWGSVYCRILQHEYPSVCKRMVLVDVGGMKPGSDIHWSTWYAIFSYQAVFAMCYWLRHPVGTWVMRLFAAVLLKAANAPRATGEVRCDMGYPYASVFKTMAKGRVAGEREFETSTAPVAHLYVYGGKKLFQFHDSDWLTFVRSTPCGQVVSLPCGHWVMHEEAEALNKVVLDWLHRTSGCASAR